MTNEPKRLVEKTRAKWDMKYPVALVKGSETSKSYGVRGFPSSYLVDTKGRIVWSGHPAALQESAIVALLPAAGPVPTLPARYEEINRTLSNGAYGKAHAQIEAALRRSRGDRDLLKARSKIESFAKQRTAAASRALEKKDYAVAVALFEELSRQFSGLPTGAAARSKLGPLRKRAEVKLDLEAAGLLKTMKIQLGAGKEAAAKDTCANLVKAFPDTASARHARKLLKKH